MFPSSGYFRGINCPYYSSGLCERPYCHYRHVKQADKDSSSLFKNLSLIREPESVVDKSRDSQTELGQTLLQLQRDIENEKARINKRKLNVEDETTTPDFKAPILENISQFSQENSPAVLYQLESDVSKNNKHTYKVVPGSKKRKELYGKTEHELQAYSQNTDLKSKYVYGLNAESQNKYVCGLESNANKYTQGYSPSLKSGIFPSSDGNKTGVPEYKPTPISELKRMKQLNLNSKYRVKSESTSDLEYDPVSNYAAGLSGKSFYQSHPITGKRKNTAYDGDSQTLSKHPKYFSEEDEDDDDNLLPVDAAFSDDSENELTEMEKESKNGLPEQEEKYQHLPSFTDTAFKSVDFKAADNGDTPGIGEAEAETRSQSDSCSNVSPGKLDDKPQTAASKSEHTELQKKSSKSGSKNSSEKSIHNDTSPAKAGKKSSKEKASKSKSVLDKKSRLDKSLKQTSSKESHKAELKSSALKPEKSKNKAKNPGASKDGMHLKQSRDKEIANKEHHRDTKKHKILVKKMKTKSEFELNDGKKKSKNTSCSSEQKKTLWTETDSSKRQDVLVSPNKIKSPKIVEMNVDLFGEDSEDESSSAVERSENEFSMIFGETDLSESDTYEECLRIFNETNAVRHSPLKLTTMPENKRRVNSMKLPPPSALKKRIAHRSSSEDNRVIRAQEPLVLRPSPAQVMHNRFLEMQKRMKEVNEKQQKKSIQPNIKNSLKPLDKRLTCLPKVATEAGCGIDAERTVIGTADKSAKRVAHLPRKETLKRPIIPVEYGSKVPTNTRQRYLDRIIDECLKLSPTEEAAFQKARGEEQSVYCRSANKTVYLNVAVNTINRLRVEVTERESVNLHPISSASRRLKLSHEAMLGGSKAAKTSFTLNRSGCSHRPITENFSGSDLYQRLLNYTLTEDQLRENGFPRLSTDNPGSAVFYKQDAVKDICWKTNERTCIRCGKIFMVSPNGNYIMQEECFYHWGKAWKKRVAAGIETRYTCCQGDAGSIGCQVAKLHVHEKNLHEISSGYMKTLPCSPPIDGDYGVYAMDCEMVYTSAGVELARVTVIGSDLKPIYETLVKPDKPVVDCNTRFSGLKDKDLENVKTTLRDVQAVLLSLFTDKSILIGHSLESDFKSVKLIHSVVVDTSVVFPHKLGPPYKRALKTLTAEYLMKIIQDSVDGHDSKEDAVASLELVHWKLREDARKSR